MRTRLVGGIVAGAFALGILTGAAGTIVVRDAATPRTDLAVIMAGQGMGSMMSMMSGSMMGPNASMGPDMMGPGASSMPGNLHEQHHASPSPEASR